MTTPALTPSSAGVSRPSPFGRGYAAMFAPERLTVGPYFPIEAFDGPEPTMHDQVKLAQAAERLGFAALWARDVPLNDPRFGDLGQLYDPFVWLAAIGLDHRHRDRHGRRHPPASSPDRRRQGSGVARSSLRRAAGPRRRFGRPTRRVPSLRPRPGLARRTVPRCVRLRAGVHRAASGQARRSTRPPRRHPRGRPYA